MANPFRKDFVEARINAKISPEKMQAMMDAKSRIYTARFIHAGVCGYKQQNDITYLSPDVLYRMADSYVGRPVVVGHDLNITNDNIEDKMKGTVVRCYTNDGDDWYVDFVVTDQKVVKKIDEEGYNFVSCAYIITEQAANPEMHDGLECTTVVLNGFYHHLAITNSPRYDGTEIWRMNDTIENNDLKKIGFSDIVQIETKENSNKEKPKMFGFKKVETAVDDEVLFDTDAGRLNTTDMISKVNELVKANEELKNKCDCADKKVADLEKEKEEKEKKDKEEEEKAKEKENELASHETSKTIPEAQAKANEDAAKSTVLNDAIPKVNEDKHVAKVTVRGLSAKK